MSTATKGDAMNETVTCRACGRKLRSQASIAAGIGPRCAAVEQATQGLNERQRDKARELVADRGVVKVRPGVYRVSASDGEQTYLVSLNGNCTCRHGLCHVSAMAKTCYHPAAARLYARPVLRTAPAAPRTALPMPPVPADVWAALEAAGALDLVPAF